MGNNAAVVSSSVKDQLGLGERAQVSVTVGNTGTTTWTAAAGYRLGSQNPQDNVRWGTGRVELPGGAPVPPGGMCTFTFTITAPAQAGTYPFQWQMLEEKVEWFGTPSPSADVRVGQAPAPTTTPPPGIRRFVPLSKTAGKRLAPSEALSLAFRPTGTDRLHARCSAAARPGRKGQDVQPVERRIEILRPGVAAPIAVASDAPDAGGLLTLDYLVQPADLTAPGDWTCRITNLDEAPAFMSCAVEYPSDRPMQTQSLALTKLDNLLRTELASLQPALHLQSGRDYLPIGNALAGVVQPRASLELPFRPPGPGDINVESVAGDVGTSSSGDLHGGSPVHRRTDLFLPGAATPIATVTDGAPRAHSLTHTVDAKELDTPGNWICRVTNLDTQPYRFTVHATQVLPRSTLDFSAQAKAEMNLSSIRFFLPTENQGGVNDVNTRPGGFPIALRSDRQSEFPGGYLEIVLTFEENGLEIDLHDLNVSHVDAIKGDLSNMVLTLRLGLAAFGGKLGLGPVSIDFPIKVQHVDVDGDLLAQAVAAIANILDDSGIYNLGDLLAGMIKKKVPALLDDPLPGGDGSRTVRSVISDKVNSVFQRLLPTAVTVYDVTVNGDQLTFGYEALAPDPSPTTYYRWPAPQNLVEKIDHIVVTMMENRSFDHVLGYLRARKHRLEIDGLAGGESNALANPKNPQDPRRGRAYQVFPYSALPPEASAVVDFDPCHESACVARQLASNNGGFVDDFSMKYPDKYPGLIMAYNDETTVPSYDFLTENYAICDRWFASVPGPTQVNRLYLLGGSSAGYHDPPEQQDHTYDIRTVFDLLTQNSVAWRYYYHNVCSLWLAGTYAFDSTNQGNIVNAGEFFERAAAGTLPPVSFLDPSLRGNVDSQPHDDDHPPGDMTCGQHFIQKVYSALTSNAQAWKRTLWIITYDEHGGWFDHVVPPISGGEVGFRRYGVRVPAFVVSPWVPARSVSHENYDHTSVIKTILQRFCRRGTMLPALSPRADDARDVGPMLSLASPRPAPPMPPVQRPCAPQAGSPGTQPPGPGDFRAWVQHMMDKQAHRPR